MEKLNVHYDKPTKKCARIVGDTMGKYHPHGDSSIYEALVVMCQPFKKEVPLIKGQGNLGSIEGDGAAAMRYTESRLEKFAQEILLQDINNTVAFISNYDGTEIEPEVLPARLPLLLVNGAEGIAVGMASSIPSHNLAEVCDLCKAYLTNPNVPVKNMLKHLPGPDFPTGGIIANRNELIHIYETGVGKIKMRGNIQFEKATSKKEHDKLVVTEIPYTMLGSGINKFLMDVADLIENKKITEICDISNQSNKDGIRLVFELKPNANVENIKNILFKKTKLEDTFGVNILAINKGKPEILSLKSILTIWYEFQKDILTKKYTALLNTEKTKNEIQAGLIKACDCIDLIIEIIRGASSIEDAKKCLVNGNTSSIKFKTKASKAKASKLSFTEPQANAVLKMRLEKLIGLELNLLKSEYEKSLDLINEYNTILCDEKRIIAILKNDLAKYKKEYAAPRKTKLLNCEEIIYEEKIEEINGYVLIDKFRYCKFIDTLTYERNKNLIDLQYPICLKTTSLSKIMIFTSTGTVCQLKCAAIPFCKYKEKGEPLENISAFVTEYDIVAAIPENQLTGTFILATKNGYIKKMDSAEFISSKREMIITKLAYDDKLIFLDSEQKKKYMFMMSESNHLIKLNLIDIPLMRKLSLGIKGMTLKSEKLAEVLLSDPSDNVYINNTVVNTNIIKASKIGAVGKIIKKEG